MCYNKVDRGKFNVVKSITCSSEKIPKLQILSFFHENKFVDFERAANWLLIVYFDS